MRAEPCSRHCDALYRHVAASLRVQRWFRRTIVAFTLITFFAATTVALLCDVRCIAQVPASGDAGEPTQHIVGTPAGPTADNPHVHVHKGGPCHLPTVSILVMSVFATIAVSQGSDEWFVDGDMRFASLVWSPPKPKPRTKPSLS